LRWLWIVGIVFCTAGVAARLASSRFEWWDFLSPLAAIVACVTALRSHRYLPFAFILFFIATAAQFIHELVAMK